MTTTRFFTKTKAKDRSKLVPVYVRVSCGRGIDIVSKTDLVIKALNWNNGTQRTRQRAENRSGGKYDFDNRIASMKKHLEDEIEKIPQSDLGSEWLKTAIDRFHHPEKYTVNLFSFIESFISRSSTRMNRRTKKPISYKMQREYEVTFGYLKKFSLQKGRNIDFKDIDLNFYDEFTHFLQESSANPDAKDQAEREKKLSVNTIGKKIQTLKIFLNAASGEGHITNPAYKNSAFVSVSEDSDAIYLNEEELERIARADLSTRPQLDRVRDLFLVGCWTGCRFSDISQVRAENISAGLIAIHQQKTGNKVLIPLHPVVTAILNKYKGELPRLISNQKFNKALKEIALEAKITGEVSKRITRGGMTIESRIDKSDMVTSHTARRSFATNLHNSGFDDRKIMQITGHRSLSAFERYIKITSDESALDLRKHWNLSHLKVVNE